MRPYILLVAMASIVSAQWGSSRDVSTYANIDDVETQHIELDFAVDFTGRFFEGSVTHTMMTMKDGVLAVFLDQVGIDVKTIQ